VSPGLLASLTSIGLTANHKVCCRVSTITVRDPIQKGGRCTDSGAQQGSAGEAETCQHFTWHLPRPRLQSLTSAVVLASKQAGRTMGQEGMLCCWLFSLLEAGTSTDGPMECM
jgi:hypothetical protein